MNVKNGSQVVHGWFTALPVFGFSPLAEDRFLPGRSEEGSKGKGRPQLLPLSSEVFTALCGVQAAGSES